MRGVKDGVATCRTRGLPDTDEMATWELTGLLFVARQYALG